MNNTGSRTQKSETDQNIHDVKPFYWILLIVLALIYGSTVYATPELQEPGRFLLFTALMLAHMLAHWFSYKAVAQQRSLIIYFVVQGVLVFLLTLVSQSQTVAVALYMALISEAVGMVGDLRRSLIILAAYGTLFWINFVLLGEQQASLPNLLFVAPMLLFALVYVMLFLRQLNAREEAQILLGELEMANQQLAAYAQQVETLTLETERQRMARELHDTLAQGLAGIILQLEALEAYLEKGDTTEATQIAGQAKNRARTALADARRAIDDLRTQSTDSLLDMINDEVDRFTVTTGIPCTLDIAMEMEMPVPMAEHVQRCVSEGLTNVARHAQASMVWVNLTESNGRCLVEVRDNGQGFDADTDSFPAGHYGLLGLRERARLAGGTFTIKSTPQQGTTLKMSLPLPSVEQNTVLFSSKGDKP